MKETRVGRLDNVVDDRSCPKWTRSVVEFVIDGIVEMIGQRELVPGTSLPTEQELTQQFEVSVVALRESTRVLKILDVLPSVPRRGTVVLQEAECTEFEQLGILLGFDFRTTANGVEARSIVDGHAVRLAAMRATKDEITDMRRILKRQRDLVSDIWRYQKEDDALHRVTVLVAHDPILVTVLDAMRPSLGVVHQQTALLPGRRKKAMAYPTRLVRAIAAHDLDGAEPALLDHVEAVATEVITRLLKRG